MKNFNPMQMMMPGGFQMNPMMMPNMMGAQHNQKININQFKQYIPNINDNIFEQLKQQARNQGISEEDIEKGMEFIKNLTKK